MPQAPELERPQTLLLPRRTVFGRLPPETPQWRQRLPSAVQLGPSGPSLPTPPAQPLAWLQNSLPGAPSLLPIAPAPPSKDTLPPSLPISSHLPFRLGLRCSLRKALPSPAPPSPSASAESSLRAVLSGSTTSACCVIVAFPHACLPSRCQLCALSPALGMEQILYKLSFKVPVSGDRIALHKITVASFYSLTYACIQFVALNARSPPGLH